MSRTVLKRLPASTLVICTRRIGDVLLTTPLLRSLRHAWPQARIDVLVFSASAPVLAGNPDVSEVLTIPERPSRQESRQLLQRIWRRYDLALSTLISDRAHALALAAAPVRVGVVPKPGETGGFRWKRWINRAWTVLYVHHCHVVEQYLRLADLLGVPRYWELVPPQSADTAVLDERLGAPWRRESYAVVHVAAMYRYKGWTVEGWRALIRGLRERQLRVCLTGAANEAERALIREVLAGLPREGLIDLGGALTLPQLTPLLEHARVFVGPDTSVTHLAAACGIATVALFGPSHPVAWGPWPKGWRGGAPSPWKMSAPLQRQGNVRLVQGVAPCVPCLQEGCERHRDSRAACLEELPPARVCAAVDEALAAASPR